MDYSKPKVTIDLDEYNELLRLKDDTNTKQTILVAITSLLKTALSPTMSLNRDGEALRTIDSFIVELRKIGIYVILSKITETDIITGRLSLDKIQLQFKDPK